MLKNNSSANEPDFSSICIEGTNVKHLERFLQDFPIDENGKIMGYPRFLMDLS